MQIDSLKELLKEKKIDEIKEKTEALNKLIQEASVELYQKAGKGSEVHETESGEKVVDGEFEEDDKKK